jgi:hypothetical protein
MPSTHQAMEFMVCSQNGGMTPIREFHQIIAKFRMCLHQILFAGSDI